MGTPIAELITDWAMTEIDDARLEELLNENPAQFMRRMWLYVKRGTPYFNNPPEMENLLTYSEPEFDDFEWTASASAEETIVQTGKVGYEIVSTSKIWRGKDGTVFSCPFPEAAYNVDSGEVTFPAGIPEGTRFAIDFYRDGSFERDLGKVELRILGKCVALAWYERFSGNWLNMQPKISDKSFTTGSEANHINAMTTRTREYRAALNDEIWRYAENKEYMRLTANGTLRR